MNLSPPRDAQWSLRRAERSLSRGRILHVGLSAAELQLVRLAARWARQRPGPWARGIIAEAAALTLLVAPELEPRVKNTTIWTDIRRWRRRLATAQKDLEKTRKTVNATRNPWRKQAAKLVMARAHIRLIEVQQAYTDWLITRIADLAGIAADDVDSTSTCHTENRPSAGSGGIDRRR